MNVVEGQASDWNSGSWYASWATIKVILLNNNTVLSDTTQSNILVGNTANGAGGAADSLNTDTVGRVGDSRR